MCCLLRFTVIFVHKSAIPTKDIYKKNKIYSTVQSKIGQHNKTKTVPKYFFLNYIVQLYLNIYTGMGTWHSERLNIQKDRYPVRFPVFSKGLQAKEERFIFKETIFSNNAEMACKHKRYVHSH